VVAYGALEWTFVGILAAMVTAAGFFAVFVVLQLFRNPPRKG